MKRRRALLSTTTLVLTLCAACGVWVHVQQRQYTRNRQLIAALQRDDTKTALALVNAGADPNTRQTPLPPPTLQNLLAQMLHRSPPPVNHSPTAFQMACGVPAIWDKNGENNYSITQEDMSLLRTMMEHGANVNAPPHDKNTALHYAVGNNRLHTVGLLVQHGAEVNAPNNAGQTPLMLAAIFDHIDLTRMLLAHGANPNKRDMDGDTALYYAVSVRGGTDGVSELLAHGADPTLRDKAGYTPLQRAQQAHRPDLVRLLRRQR